MTRFLILLVCLLIGCGSHLTAPDGDDMNQIVGRLSAAPAADQDMLRAYAARQAAMRLVGDAETTKIGEVQCGDDRPREFTGRDFLDCLQRAMTASFRSCADSFIERERLVARMLGLGEDDCRWVWAPGWAPDEKPAEDAAERLSLRDAIEIILALRYPPPVEIQAIFFSVGLFGPAGALCALAVDWGCSEIPPDQQRPGGDR